MENDPRQPSIQVVQLVCASFLFATFAFGVIPFVSSGASNQPTDVPLNETGMILVGLGLINLFGAVPIGKLFLRREPDPLNPHTFYTPQSFFTARLITFALWEAVALYGFLVYSLNRNLTVCLMLCGCALGAMIGFFPKAKSNSPNLY